MKQQWKQMKMKKKINPRAQPTTAKAKGKINLTWELLRNIFFVTYLNIFKHFLNMMIPGFWTSSNFEILTHIWNSELNISLMTLQWYHISSNKCLWHLLNFETVKYGAYLRAALISKLRKGTISSVKTLSLFLNET